MIGISTLVQKILVSKKKILGCFFSMRASDLEKNNPYFWMPNVFSTAKRYILTNIRLMKNKSMKLFCSASLAHIHSKMYKLALNFHRIDILSKCTYVRWNILKHDQCMLAFGSEHHHCPPPHASIFSTYVRTYLLY